jgi:hypothetical protein
MDKREYGEEGGDMNSEQKEIMRKEITETLFSNASKVLFGVVSVELKIHEGRCVAVTYSTTENTKQKETSKQLDVHVPI